MENLNIPEDETSNKETMAEIIKKSKALKEKSKRTNLALNDLWEQTEKFINPDDSESKN